MPRASRPQVSFNQGEWSPLTYGRADVEQRAKAMEYCRDFLPCMQGPLTRRPGTAYVAGVKGNDTAVRFQRFVFNTVQSYVLEFTNQAIRFYTNGGQLLSSGSPYTVTTPYLAADLWGLSFAQSADVLYITHAGYAPRKLSRHGATDWSLDLVDLIDGPYLNQNVSDTYLACSVSRVGSTGTLTATTTTGINGGAGFQSGDVGRLFRVQNTKYDGTSTDNPTQWLWVKVNSVTDTKHASVTVQGITAVAA